MIAGTSLVRWALMAADPDPVEKRDLQRFVLLIVAAAVALGAIAFWVLR